jgi:Flp pilus assembly protein TadG
VHKAITSIFCSKRGFIAQQSGATIILVAIMLPLLIAGMALSVDVARLYLVQTKAQNALDNAMLGSVATETSVPNVIAEATRLFNANFPSGYMGSTIPAGINVVESPTNVFTGAITVSVPTSILKPITRRTVFNPNSQVTRGFQNSTQNLEMAVAIDTSTAMNTTKLGNVRIGINTMLNNLFGAATTSNNINVSIVPFTNAVNIGAGREAWIQPGIHRSLYSALSRVQPGRLGNVSNRNQDGPRNNLNDFSNVLPTTAAGQFRVPRNAFGGGAARDTLFNRVSQIAFALNSRTALNTILSGLSCNGNALRANVGLMWGWFTLSPTWQGVWGAPTTKPAAASSTLRKSLVLVVSGRNNVFLGNGTTISNDDTSTGTLCTLIKSQGIRIYVVAYNTAANLNTAMLSTCASSASDYYLVNTPAEVTSAFTSISSVSSGPTVRLTR